MPLIRRASGRRANEYGIAASECGPENERMHIDWLDVPEHGKGRARKLYEEWEAALPPTIKVITLEAVDAGSGDATGFWQKMGFWFVWTWNAGLEPEPPIEVRQEMVKVLHPGTHYDACPKEFWETMDEGDRETWRRKGYDI
jgi:hypothetical protein